MNMLKQIITTLIFFAVTVTAFSQEETTKPLTISGYAEGYYSLDAAFPNNHERPFFLYSYKRHNEVNINLAYLKAAYLKGNVRGNLALMVGNYAQYNLSGEEQLARNIFEANVGFKICKNHNLWLDAGVMPSHIGFESAIGKDNWVLSRSLAAENSPYYETGVKVGYTSANEKWYAAGMFLNGWQKISRPDFQDSPAFGTQLTYKPSGNFTANWSTYYGNELVPNAPGEEERWRFFNNFYTTWQATEKLGVITGFDIGLQERGRNIDPALWYTPIVIFRFNPSEKWRIGLRGEFYADEDEVIVATGTPNGFQTSSGSLNIDYLPADNVMLRFEGRAFNSKDRIFELNGDPSKQNYAFTTALAISF